MSEGVRERKNALVLFSKVPEPGRVKTRLTPLKDGIFPPETASVLYHCMLFDVVEIIMAAMDELEARDLGHGPGITVGSDGKPVHDTYELVISTAPAENVPAMRALFEDAGTWPRPIVYIADTGANFDKHYNDAFNQTWERGADTILSMGADMPALTRADVRRGFEVLHELEITPQGGIVLAPDQAMGVSIVGWPRQTAFNADGSYAFTHDGVYYCQTGLTVLPAYIQKAREAGLPARYLPAVPDVDTMGDLMHNVTLVEALNYCAPFDGDTPPWRTANALKEMGWDQIIVAPNDLRDPRDGIDVEE